LSAASRKGLLLAALIMLGWLVSLAGLLIWDLSATQLARPWVWLALLFGVVGRTLLQTGLFIVGHDAMHGVLWPNWRE